MEESPLAGKPARRLCPETRVVRRGQLWDSSVESRCKGPGAGLICGPEKAGLLEAQWGTGAGVEGKLDVLGGHVKYGLIVRKVVLSYLQWVGTGMF